MRAAIALLLLTGMFASAPAIAGAGGPQAAGGSSRERSGLAEDQALLQRQLARLRQTMEILAARFEAEGRAHAAKLLREGLSHLGERGGEQGAKTLDELMGGSKSSLESGQTVQAVETQEAAVKSLEKLYAILTDRQGLDDLDKSLDELRKIKDDLASLADREKDLRAKTDALGSQATSPERKALQEGIQKAIEAERSLLARTETRARESGEMEIESIARELEALAERQATDAAVLESWKPEERAPLEAASPELAASQEAASTAQRLAQSARELRTASAAARDPKNELGPVARGLESAAEREERRERAAAAAANPNETRASKALRAGASAVNEAQPTPEGRANAARALDEHAAALEKAAEEALASARAKQREAAAALAQVAESKGQAGEIARRTRAALEADNASPGAQAGGSDERAQPGVEGSPTGAREKGDAKSGSKPDAAKEPSPPPGSRDASREAGSQPKSDRDAASREAAKSLEERADDARRAAAEAGRTLNAGLEDQATLPRALSASQARAAEESTRLERALGALPEGASEPGSQARRALSAASEAQSSAAKSASEGRPAESASAAQTAKERLDAAREALAAARKPENGARPESPEEKALEKEQEETARSLESLEAKAAQVEDQGSPSAAGGRDAPAGETKQALAAAKAAMQAAAKSLASRSPSSASKSQRESLSELEKAAAKAGDKGPLTKPEDKEQAEALAKEQERIRQELLELSRRNQKRDAARPTPSLGRASSSASKAQNQLEEGDLDSAEENEGDAEREMRQALSSLSEEEEQYQKLRAEELLFKVAEQVKALQDAHRDAMRETKEIDGGRKSADTATHTQRLRLRKVSKSEEGLAGRAADMEKAIREEESLVFAEVLERVNRDLVRVAKDLGDEGGFQSGERVQAVQQDVDQGLAWLHQALQAEKERRRQEESPESGSGQQASNQRGRNRLVADAAELKLLRQLEVENLDALEKFKAAHPELAVGAKAPPEGSARPRPDVEIDPRLLEDLSRLADRHQRTSDLFEKFRKRLGLPDPGSEEP
jgi:hypothetical protein